MLQGRHRPEPPAPGAAAGRGPAGGMVADRLSGPVLRFQPQPPGTDAPDDGAARDDVVVVLDTTWLPETPEGRREHGATLSLRDAGERVLAARDVIEETADLLDDWAASSGVIDAMAFQGTSFWYYVRLRHWSWLQQQVLWLGIVDDLVRRTSPRALVCAPGADPGLIGAAQRLAVRDGIPCRIETAPDVESSASPVAPGPSPAVASRSPTLAQRADRLRLRLLGRLEVRDQHERRAYVVRRLRRLAREPGRLLIVLEHARQRVDTPSGPRFLNPYLGPIAERLRRTRLKPIEIDIRARLTADETWTRLNEWGGDRLLPSDAVWLSGAPWPPDEFAAEAEARACTIAASTTPVRVSGVDLGPALADRVAAEARRSLADQLRGLVRNRRLLQSLRPAGVLLADEYHRQAWLAAADAEGIPTAAIQHGMIYRRHNGYIHRERPPSLRLPSRTYVFGRWEADLLTSGSVYRPDEVRVGGSPRLDLVRPRAVDREAVRAELGVAAGYRLVVISGTWGELYRRFHFPIALSRIVDRPLPNVHLVVKLHPGEPDEGPYRAMVEGRARSLGFEAPPVTVIQAIDLYRLLAAADAHLGVHSTVLTEAVAAGTPNLLAHGLAGADLLGYVAAGVAHPVRDGGELLAALDGRLGGASDEARRAFLESHFEPGDASRRIADDLLAWL